MRAKRILIVLAAVAGLLALAAAAALNPAVQTWAARRRVAGAHRARVSVSRVSADLGQANIEGLRIERADMVLLAPLVHAEMEVAPALLGKGYHVDALTARGWTLDLTQSPQAAAAQSEAAAPWPTRAVGAVLSAFYFPENLSLSGVDLEGDVIFPGEDGKPAGRVHVVVTGGGLSPGGDGRFLCSAEAALDDRSAPVSKVSVSATLTASIEASGALLRADLKADATASGTDVPAGIGLSFEASAAHRSGIRSYTVTLTRGNEHIAAVDAQNPDGSLKMAGTWSLNLRDTDLNPFALGRSLPAFYVAGSGSVVADASSGDVHAAGKLQATADRLGVLARGLAPLGRVNLAADFDVARVGAALRVSRLETSLASASPVASVRALQSFEFNTSTGELKVAVPSGDLVGISVTGMPLAWLDPVIPHLGVTGGDLRGDFVMRAEDGRLVLRTKAPLTTSGVTVGRAGAAAASGLELSAFILADYAAQGWQIQLAPFEVRSEGTRLLSLETRFGRLAGASRAIKAAGSWSVSLPVLSALPLAAGLERLSGGVATGSFEASLDATSEVQLKLSVRDLALASGSAAQLPGVDSEIRAEFEPEGRTSFSVPLRLDYGARTAEIAVKGTVQSGPNGPLFDAALEGSQVTGEEIAALSLLARGGVQASPRGPGVPAAPSPFWPRVRGKFALRFDAISLRKVDLRDVRGTLIADPSSLEVAAGSATLGGGGTARLDGRLIFLAGAPSPYSFHADLSIGSLDSAPLFRAIDPSKPALIDGRFDLESHLRGVGTGAGDLLDGLQGDVKLISKDGAFRALQADIIDSIKQTPSRIVDALDTVSALFGKKTNGIGQALLESAREVSEIHYDQMTVTAERVADMDLRLTSINLISPEVRVTGTGRITYAQGVALQDQPLSVDLELGARGQLGKVLDVVGLLSDERDPLGYAKLVQPIHLGGTLRAVDQSQWKDLLVQASLKKGGGLFDKLLGR